MSISAGVTKTLSGLVLALGLAAVGCGPSPAYYDEPRTPAGYEVPPGVSTAPEPTPSATLAQQQPVQQQQAPVVQAQGAIEAQPSDVAIGASADEYTDTDPSALTDFRAPLENHGTWVDDSTYGTIWVPSQTEVGTDFQPYVTAGHWTYSDQTSWVWVSDYDWGWVPFHYGRWVYLAGHGWSWIPGRTYSGAWVVWRTGPYGYDYVGWAPAPPDWYWYNGYAVGWTFGWYHPRYVYCSHDYIYRPYVHQHVVYGGTPAAAPIEARTQPYRPASPGVAGSGRVVATPSVGGTGRVVATPGVGGRVNGPNPTQLGMKVGSISPPPTGDAKLARAEAFATPSTAKALGATPPAQVRPRRVDPDVMAGAPAARADRFGAVDRVSPSVASRLDPVARAPQVQGVAPRPTPSPSTSMTDSTPFNRSTPPSSGFAAGQTGRTAPLVDHWSRPTPSPSSPSPSAPTYRSNPSVHASAPTFRSPGSSSFSSSTPSYHPPSSVGGGSTFRSAAPSVRSVPSTPSSPSRATPSVRSGGSRGGRR